MKVLRESGSYQKNKVRKKLFLVITCIITFVILFVPALPNTPFFIDVGDFEMSRNLFSVIPVILGMRWWGEYKNFKLGLEGENHVKKILKSLPDEYYLINDASHPNVYGNIDHIILAPNGIFVIETKNYRGKINCHDDDWSKTSGGKIGRSPSKQAKGNAYELKNIIESLEQFKSFKLWVQPIVFFSNYDVELNVKNSPDFPVKILESPFELLNYIMTYRKYQFSPQELDLIRNEILRQTS